LNWRQAALLQPAEFPGILAPLAAVRVVGCFEKLASAGCMVSCKQQPFCQCQCIDGPVGGRPRLLHTLQALDGVASQQTVHPLCGYSTPSNRGRPAGAAVALE